MTTERPLRRPKRAHAAAGGRILAAGLSASAALALVGAMAGPTPATPTGAPAAPTVVVVRRTSGSPASATAEPAPAVTPTAAPPVTTSQAS